MSWEQITSAIDSFTNKPLVVTLMGILTFVVAAFVLFAKTSFGRRAILKLTHLYNLGDEKAAQTLKKVHDVEILAKERIEALEVQYAQKVEELKNDYEQKVCALISIVNYYEESLFALVDQIPNTKVKAKAEELKAQYQEKKKQITDVVGVIYQDYSGAVEKSKEEIRKEYDEKIAYLSEQVKQLSLYISEIKEDAPNGERKESENSDPTEEEI